MFEVRKILKFDNPGIASVIRQVMPEFGADRPGFALFDPEVDDMYSAYNLPRTSYYVVVHGIEVLGGAGIAPLKGSNAHICELQKMYFLPELRGKGFGTQLLERCLRDARKYSYQECYLETLESMHAAKSLYEKFGFIKLCSPKGSTGHFLCDAWYSLRL